MDTSTNPKPRKRALKSPAERRANHNATERIRREALNDQFLELAAELPPNMIQQCTVPMPNGQKKPSKTHIITQTWRFVRGLKMKILLRENLISQLISQNCELMKALNDLKSRSDEEDGETEDTSVGEANQIVAMLNQHDQLIDAQMAEMNFSYQMGAGGCLSPAPSVLSHTDSIMTADEHVAGDSVLFEHDLADSMITHQPVAFRPRSMSILSNTNNQYLNVPESGHVVDWHNNRSQSVQLPPLITRDLKDPRNCQNPHQYLRDPFLSTPDTPFTVTSMATTNDGMLQYDDVDASQFIINETLLNIGNNNDEMTPVDSNIKNSGKTFDATEMMKQYQMMFDLQQQ